MLLEKVLGKHGEVVTVHRMTVAKNSYGEVLPDEWDEVGEMRCVLSALNTLRDDYRR